MTLQKALEQFDEIIGEIPAEALMQKYGKEFCVMCGHPTKADDVVGKLRNIFTNFYRQLLTEDIERLTDRINQTTIAHYKDKITHADEELAQIQSISMNHGAQDILSSEISHKKQLLSELTK